MGKVFPDELEEHVPGEQFDFQFDFVDELNGDTAGSGTVRVTDSDGQDVTAKIAPASGVLENGGAAAWTVSGTTFTVTLQIPREGWKHSYVAACTLVSSTSGEQWTKYLGIEVFSPSGLL